MSSPVAVLSDCLFFLVVTCVVCWHLAEHARRHIHQQRVEAEGLKQELQLGLSLS